MVRTKRKPQKVGLSSARRTRSGRRILALVSSTTKAKKKRRKTTVEEEEEWFDEEHAEEIVEKTSEKPPPKKKKKNNEKTKKINRSKEEDTEEENTEEEKKKTTRSQTKKKSTSKKKVSSVEEEKVEETDKTNKSQQQPKGKKKTKKNTTQQNNESDSEKSLMEEEEENEEEKEEKKEENKKAKKKSKKSTAMVHLQADNRKQDPILMKTVCFNVDVGYGKKLVELIGEREDDEDWIDDASVKVEGKRFLFGTIVRLSSQKKNSLNSYDVQWESSGVGEVSIDLPVLISAIETADQVTKLVNSKISKRNKSLYKPSHLFGSSVARALMLIEEGEDGDPLGSDEDSDEEDGSISNIFTDLRNHDEIFGLAPEYLDEGNDALTTNEEDNCGNIRFQWSSNVHLNAPGEKSNYGDTKVKAQHIRCFASPLSSLMAFVPMKIFKAMVYFSNIYAHGVMENNNTNTISGALWTNDVTLKEMMTFWGILIHMCLRPTPGQTYVSCWSNYSWHPYTRNMPLRRFQQIRSVLHLNDNSKMEGSSDQLFKVRLLLNCLKNTFPSYLQLGDEVALDEASVASRSKYGRNLIFYNPSKPDKYHFRFYLLCCATSFAAVRLRVHTNDRSDLADGFSGDVITEEEKNEVDENDEDEDDGEAGRKKKKKTKISSIVMDMCRPLFGSGRVVNMDNYYSSPEVAVMLKRKGVFMRGTCRKNRRGFPKGVLYTKSEATKLRRGNYKLMVDPNNKMVCYGWVDGSPVQIISTADGSVSASCVQRKLGAEATNVKAPLCVKMYNKKMQGVDRHDQMRATFSLVARHGFKKYYIKLMLGLMDMAITNAFIHYKLVNPELGTRSTARYDFMNGLANALCTTNWNDFGNSEEGRSTDTIFNALCMSNQVEDATIDQDIMLQQEEIIAGENEESNSNNYYCQPISYKKFIDKDRNKRGSLRCQVCIFEGRKTRELRNVAICSQHALRLCIVAHDHVKLYKDEETKEEINDYSWRAPEGLSCWQKAHQFYIPRGLFDISPIPISVESPSGQMPRFQKSKVSSDIYTKKRIAFGLKECKRGRQKQKKEKTPPGGYVQEIEEVGETHIEEAHDLRPLGSPRQSMQLGQGIHLEEVHMQEL